MKEKDISVKLNNFVVIHKLMCTLLYSQSFDKENNSFVPINDALLAVYGDKHFHDELEYLDYQNEIEELSKAVQREMMKLFKQVLEIMPNIDKSNFNECYYALLSCSTTIITQDAGLQEQYLIQIGKLVFRLRNDCDEEMLNNIVNCLPEEYAVYVGNLYNSLIPWEE